MLDTLYKKASFPYIVLLFLTILSTIALWSPFILKSSTINGITTPHNSFETVLKNWDGPLYIVSAKTLYDPNNPIMQTSPLGLDYKYFAAHLPLYPLTLRLFAPLTGYPKATVFSTLLASIALIFFFYYMVKKLQLSKKPLLLSIVFLFITPRFFVVRSVGSPEPLFLLLILVSVFFFIKEKYLLAGLFGGLSVMTKSPGILLFFAYSLVCVSYYVKNKMINWNWLWILLIPAGLITVFTIYYFQYNDFWAYFHSGDNLHLLFPPFSVFNYQKTWVDTGWLEEIIFIYFFYLMAIFSLSPFANWFKNTSEVSDSTPRMVERSNRTFFIFMLVFFLSIISIQHRDISRYSLPLLPFALIAFEDFFTSKKFIIALILLLPALYAYAWNFMLYNIAPIADWTIFL